MSLVAYMQDPLLMMLSSILLGQFIGKINFKGFKLGSAGALFVGIGMSYYVTDYLLRYNRSATFLRPEIPSAVFQLSLMGFIASVGLLASQNIRGIIKENGYRFMVLAAVVTGSGAMTAWGFTRLLAHANKISILGTYPGALTSSPALAVALELAKKLGDSGEVQVGLGYTISYIPAIATIVLFVQLLAKGHKDNGTSHKALQEPTVEKTADFNIIAFAIVGVVGTIIGGFSIPLGSFGELSLGATGGVLITALVLGDRKKIGSLSFDMDKRQLGVVRDISLNMFLATVGFNYGYAALSMIKETGITLLAVGATTTIISVGIGYLIGKLLGLSTVNLIGGICGAMTSTPGLCASMEALGNDEVTAAYGAVYPFGLFFKILMINILFRL